MLAHTFFEKDIFEFGITNFSTYSYWTFSENMIREESHDRSCSNAYSDAHLCNIMRTLKDNKELI
jgi:hypothetical protein